MQDSAAISPIFDNHCWLVRYFCLALECDIPVLEAVFLHPPEETLQLLTEDFYSFCRVADFKKASTFWLILERYDKVSWIWLQNTFLNDAAPRGRLHRIVTVRFPKVSNIWSEIECNDKISDNAKIDKFLAVASKLDQTESRFFIPSEAESRDASPVRSFPILILYN